jgi:putative transposase
MNLKSRVDDLEIHRFTSYIEVKKILEARFLRRKENRIEGGDAFPGQDGQRDDTSVPGVSVTFVDRNVTAHGRTPSKPQRREPDVGDGNTIDSLSPSPMGRAGETRRLESEYKRSA